MSDVWNYFEKIRENGDKGKIVQAKCKKCKKVLSYSTSGQKNHLKSHEIDLDQISSNADQHLQSTSSSQSKITTFFPTVKLDTLNAFLARLAARRGIPFSTLASEEMTMLLKSNFNGVPTSAKTITKYVLQFAEEVKDIYKFKMKQAKDEIGFLSVSFDEWTSLKNRKYMSLIIHSDVTLWNLGLIRIRGKTNHFLAVADLEQKLSEFNLCTNDLISIITDSASINSAISKDINKNHQKCLAHALQLAVKLSFYQNDEFSNESYQTNDEEDSSDIENDHDEEIDELFSVGLDENLPRLKFKGNK